MKIYSYTQIDNHLLPVEVEVALTRGLPQMHIVGLPDQHIKESQQRIKSALKAQGYDLPKTQQIIINLRPTHLKKNSRGLDLAIAMGILQATQQINLEKEVLCYGELDLSGNVFTPEDLQFAEVDKPLFTGKNSWSLPAHYQLENLKDLSNPSWVENSVEDFPLERPENTLYYTETEAKWLSLIALGEHNTLFAGPGGSGKTTMAKALWSLLPPPTPSELKICRKYNQNYQMKWKPFIAPHHTTPLISLVGGGNYPGAGEITRAHLGVLLLDEMLEFNPKVIESLREPMESGTRRIARGTYVQLLPSKPLVVATTNLCPCGDYVPGRPVSCRYNLTRCRSYSQKLSGPFVDRFDIMIFTQKQNESRDYSITDILKKIEASKSFAKESRKQWLPNRDLTLNDFKLSEFEKHFFAYPSQRREIATLKIARSIADLELSEVIKPTHFEQARAYTLEPFEKLKRWD